MGNCLSTQDAARITTYLAKLGFKSPLPKLSLAFLTALQTNHIHTFTHDTLDSYFKRPIILDAKIIIDKFFKEQRGGLCFELNGAFCYLLQQLGFDATLLSAHVRHFNDKVIDYPVDDHAVIMVSLNGKSYLVDVGFSDASRKPIELVTGSHEDISGIYKCSVNAGSHELYKFLSGTWFLQYDFTLVPKKLSDFRPNLDFVFSPGHNFSSNIVCTRSTASGHIVVLCTVDDGLSMKRKLLIRNGTERQEFNIETFDEVKSLLVSKLGMSEALVIQLNM